jgi:hypothetical protein
MLLMFAEPRILFFKLSEKLLNLASNALYEPVAILATISLKRVRLFVLQPIPAYLMG